MYNYEKLHQFICYRVDVRALLNIPCNKSESSDDDRDDRDDVNEDSTASTSESNDEDTRAEFEPVDTSVAGMKFLGGKWLCKAIHYLKSYPSILTNGFKAAGITDALGIAVYLTKEMENHTVKIRVSMQHPNFTMNAQGCSDYTHEKLKVL